SFIAHAVTPLPRGTSYFRRFWCRLDTSTVTSSRHACQADAGVIREDWLVGSSGLKRAQKRRAGAASALRRLIPGVDKFMILFSPNREAGPPFAQPSGANPKRSPGSTL